jgi:hypothetical protein
MFYQDKKLIKYPLVKATLLQTETSFPLNSQTYKNHI